MNKKTTSDALKKEQARLEDALGVLIEKHRQDGSDAQEKIRAVCNALRRQVSEFETSTIRSLEEQGTAEEKRLQDALIVLQESAESKDKLPSAVKAAEKEALMMQTYDVVEGDVEGSIDLVRLCGVRTRKAVTPYYKPRKVEGLKVWKFTGGRFYLTFNLNAEDEEALSGSAVDYKVSVWKRGGNGRCEEHILEKDEGEGEGCSYSFLFGDIECGSVYVMRVKALYGGSVESDWSEEAEFMKGALPDIGWKRWTGYREYDCTYAFEKKNPKIAIVTKYDTTGWCTIIANKTLPFNKVITWTITIRKWKRKLKSVISDFQRNTNFVGVAPFDIDQSNYINYGYGWYINCYNATLCAGSPHNCSDKEYGPKKKKKGKKDEAHVPDGTIVSVVMDTAKGELSFGLNGVDYGVAFTGIPLDKPLLPCVVLGISGYSAELNVSGIWEYQRDATIPTPFIIRTRTNGWDSITLSWTAIEGAAFYQIEVDGSKSLYVSATNTFTKKGFFQGREHSFRIRTVRGHSLSRWSNVVKGRTQDAPPFSGVVWVECPEYVEEEREYTLDEHSNRIASKADYVYHPSTVIGDRPLPLNSVVSWRIRVMKSTECFYKINVGVAPSDIDQNDCGHNHRKCGWYYDCSGSALWSGPPHRYLYKPYGPKRVSRDRIAAGTVVSVVMDTTNGDLSFALDGVNLGVAYRGIPLDKPLVPCVVLFAAPNSVELIA